MTPIKRILCALIASTWLLPATDLERIKYNHPGLVVDLGVGLWAWPMPVDWDGDGDLEVIVGNANGAVHAIQGDGKRL